MQDESKNYPNHLIRVTFFFTRQQKLSGRIEWSEVNIQNK